MSHVASGGICITDIENDDIGNGFRKIQQQITCIIRHQMLCATDYNFYEFVLRLWTFLIGFNNVTLSDDLPWYSSWLVAHLFLSFSYMQTVPWRIELVAFQVVCFSDQLEDLSSNSDPRRSKKTYISTYQHALAIVVDHTHRNRTLLKDIRILLQVRSKHL